KIYEVPGVNRGRGGQIGNPRGKILTPKSPGPPHPHSGRYTGRCNDTRRAGRLRRPAPASVASTLLPLLDDVGAAVDDPVLVRPGDPDRHPSGDGPIAHVPGVLGVPGGLVSEGEHDVGAVFVQHPLVA